MKTVGRSTHNLDRDRLDSWKELACYLDREVRTVQRWEKHEGLPVHRHIHAKASSVYAFKHEIDAWQLSRRWAASESVPKRECPLVVESRIPNCSFSWMAGFAEISGCCPRFRISSQLLGNWAQTGLWDAGRIATHSASVDLSKL